MNMMNPLNGLARLAVLTCALVAVAAAPSPASQAAGPKPVVLALPAVIPPTREPSGRETTTRALVVRFANREKHDVIVLRREDATPETLAAAIILLQRIRASVPDPKHDRVATLVSYAPPALPDSTRNSLRAKVRELRSQRPVDLGNLGFVAWPELGVGQKLVLSDAILDQ